MWFSLLGGGYLLATGGYNYWIVSQLRSEGITTLGTLVDSETVKIGRSRTSYRVTLDYQPDGSELALRKEFTVPQVLYHLALQAKQLPVTYLPRNPGTAQVGTKPTLDLEPLAMGAGLLLIALVTRLYLWRKMQQVEASDGSAAE